MARNSSCYESFIRNTRSQYILPLDSLGDKVLRSLELETICLRLLHRKLVAPKHPSSCSLQICLFEINMNRFNSILKAFLGPALIVGVLTLLWFFRGELFNVKLSNTAEATKTNAEIAEKQTVLEISEQARKNLGLISKPAKPQDYWRSVLIPGEIADRPGLSDRGVTSPAVGIVTAIHAFPGNTIHPGESMFTLRLFSEYLQNTQSELFKATQEIQLIQQEIERLSGAARSGAIPESRLIESRQQLNRQTTLVRAYEQDLLTRGLTPEQIQQVANGQFVSTIEVAAPPAMPDQAWLAPSDTNAVRQVSTALDASSANDQQARIDIAYEVQELRVELGQQVQAGQVLAQLANHLSLYVVGHAFKREAQYLADAAKQSRPVEIEFADDTQAPWPELQQSFAIHHLSNSLDSSSQTFDFFIPLANQFQAFEKENETHLIWRFRPGQRARIYVPVEKYENVYVLPSEAVVRVGPEAYVFRQNGDLFKQIPVHVLHEDRRSVVIANDGNIAKGSYLAQNAAASLNRVLKAQMAGGQQPGVHVHADGTTHAAH
jgi:membrane fusion protein, heavy metal efflux system